MKFNLSSKVSVLSHIRVSQVIIIITGTQLSHPHTYSYIYILIYRTQSNSYNFQCIYIMGINSSEMHNTKSLI